jgi:DNA-binding MarR family transcriptional regulator
VSGTAGAPGSYRKIRGGRFAVLAQAQTETPAELVDRILALASRLSRTINADVRQQKLSVSLTMGQFRTLSHLAAGMTSSADLAEYLVVTRPTITRLIDGLVRKGLVARTPGAGDRRQVNLELTDAGRSVLREFRRKASKRIQARLDQLSSADQELVRRAVTVLDKRLLAGAPGLPPSE